jgi:hypothetical protein
MMKIVVAFPTSDTKGYSVEYVEGDNLSMTIDKETHDVTISGKDNVFLAVFTNWLWVKRGKD